MAILVLGQDVLEGDGGGVHTTEPLALQRLPGVDPLAGVEGQHPVQQLEGGARHEEAELLPHPPPVLLLGLQLLETGQVDDLEDKYFNLLQKDFLCSPLASLQGRESHRGG